MFGRGKPEPLVGLDIGSSAVKAVELKQSGGEVELVSFGLEPLAQNSLVDSAIVDRAAVTEAIGRVFEQQKIKGRSVATSVSGHSVIVKRLSFSATRDDDLAGRVRNEAGQHVPFDLSEVNLSYEVLDAESRGQQIEVLLVAAKKDKIEAQVEVVNQAGRNTHIVDIDACALQNCFEVNYVPEPGHTVVLLDIGTSLMNIAIARSGQPLFIRDVSIAGNQYTEALDKQFGLGFEQCEKLKKGEDLPGIEEKRRIDVLRAVSQTLALEIEKTLDFLRASASGQNIERIYVSGGTARVPGLLALLEEEFSVPVEEMNPFLKIRVSARHEEEIREFGPRLAIAVGLALRSFDTP